MTGLSALYANQAMEERSRAFVNSTRRGERSKI